MAMEVACSQCSGVMLVEQGGVVVACPHCGVHLAIPALSDASTSSAEVHAGPSEEDEAAVRGASERLERARSSSTVDVTAEIANLLDGIDGGDVSAHSGLPAIAAPASEVGGRAAASMDAMHDLIDAALPKTAPAGLVAPATLTGRPAASAAVILESIFSHGPAADDFPAAIAGPAAVATPGPASVPLVASSASTNAPPRSGGKKKDRKEAAKRAVEHRTPTAVAPAAPSGTTPSSNAKGASGGTASTEVKTSLSVASLAVKSPALPEVSAPDSEDGCVLDFAVAAAPKRTSDDEQQLRRMVSQVASDLATANAASVVAAPAAIIANEMPTNRWEMAFYVVSLYALAATCVCGYLLWARYAETMVR